jgi:hypothetical protein
MEIIQGTINCRGRLHPLSSWLEWLPLAILLTNHHSRILLRSLDRIYDGIARTFIGQMPSLICGHFLMPLRSVFWLFLEQGQSFEPCLLSQSEFSSLPMLQ